VIQARCTSCHVDFRITSDAAWAKTGLIVPGSIEKSNFYKRIIGNGLPSSIAPIQNMPTPPLMPLAAGEITILKEWISQMVVNTAPPPPIPTGPLGDGTGPEVSTLDSKLRLGDRRYVASVFLSVFGNSAEVSSLVSQLITSQVETFGGARDGQDTSDLECFKQTVNGVTRCVSRQETLAPALPSSSTNREASRIRACSMISSKDAAIRHAIAQARGLPSADLVNPQSVTMPTDADINAAFEMFFAARTLNSAPVTEAVKSLVARAGTAVGGQPASNFEAWRFLFYALCLAPDWQAP
jgi:hypothetical protein